MRLSFILVSAFLLIGCQQNEPMDIADPVYHKFSSYNEFKATINAITNITDEVEREVALISFWDSLKVNHQIPFVFGDSVAFLYISDGKLVKWAGDFSGWRPVSGKEIGESQVWMLEKVFPSDARLDYKVVVGEEWILDPDNEYIQYSGWGPNSELRMPGWVYPKETILKEGIKRGALSDNQFITASSSSLNYKVQYKVYTPVGYENLSDLPVIYVTDGHEYSDNKLGSMLIVLDNLITEKKIVPVIAVFIDPRDPDNLSENKRGDQYTGNNKFADFVADELASTIDANYKTNPSPDARAILGTSLGGWNSAFFGATRSDKFHLIGIHSPAFDDNVISAYKNLEKLPLKVFMSTGVVYDTQDRARAMKAVMEDKGYPLEYIEVNEGHSWGNWRALIEEPLVYFFGI